MDHPQQSNPLKLLCTVIIIWYMAYSLFYQQYNLFATTIQSVCTTKIITDSMRPLPTAALRNPAALMYDPNNKNLI